MWKRSNKNKPQEMFELLQVYLFSLFSKDPGVETKLLLEWFLERAVSLPCLFRLKQDGKLSGSREK